MSFFPNKRPVSRYDRDNVDFHQRRQIRDIQDIVFENAIELQPQILEPLEDPKKIQQQREKFLKQVPENVCVKISYFDPEKQKYGFHREVFNENNAVTGMQVSLDEKKLHVVQERFAATLTQAGVPTPENFNVKQTDWTCVRYTMDKKSRDFRYAQEDKRFKGRGNDE